MFTRDQSRGAAGRQDICQREGKRLCEWVVNGTRRAQKRAKRVGWCIMPFPHKRYQELFRVSWDLPEIVRVQKVIVIVTGVEWGTECYRGQWRKFG